MQRLLVLGIVFIAAFYLGTLLRRKLRSLKKLSGNNSGGCASACGGTKKDSAKAVSSKKSLKTLN